MVIFSSTDGSQILSVKFPETVQLAPWQMRGLLDALRHPALHGLVRVQHGNPVPHGEPVRFMSLSDKNNVNDIAVDTVINNAPTLFGARK